MSETDTATQNITNSKIRHTTTQDQLYGATTHDQTLLRKKSFPISCHIEVIFK
jgi:hypothetical protein